MTLTNAFTLVPRDLKPCANGLLPKASYNSYQVFKRLVVNLISLILPHQWWILRFTNTLSFNVKVNALSKGKEKKKHKSRRKSEGSHDEGCRSHLSRSSRSQRSERIMRHGRHKDEPKRNPIDLIKEKKAEQNLECFDCGDIVKVNLIALSFEGYKGVEEYFKEMEVTLIRAQVVDCQEVTMARFLHGLN
ncbi:hypothetical protein CR513_43574, partial [Mucuna pruriens]